MQTIRLSTWINAPVERCFKLALSVDLHVASGRSTGERAIAGVTTGLLGAGETVEFQARHFGREVYHTIRVDAWRPYAYFRDAMIAGEFERFEHDHHFAAMDDGTRMRDEIRFSAPFGFAGRVAEKLFLRRYLTLFVAERNAMIKRVAESQEWRKYLDGRPEVKPVARATPGVVGRWDQSALMRG